MSSCCNMGSLPGLDFILLKLLSLPIISKPSNSGISTESLCELIAILLTKNHFQFKDDDYLHTMGYDMSTKMALRLRFPVHR